MNKQFWKNKRVFITGHTGFKGSWLTLWLKLLGAEITGYSLKAIAPSLFQLANVNEGMRSWEGDVRNIADLTACLKEARPEIVFHMAAQPLVRYSYQHPIETYETNVMGTVNILEAVRHTPGIKAVVVVTSDKCYENLELNRGYKETDPMGGHDPYASSKGCAELVTAAYRTSYLSHVPTSTVRAGNVIGGGDWAVDRLIPDIMRAFADNKTVTIRNPQAIRPWQHVLEPLSGYMLLAQKLFEKGTEFAEGWNFGPHQTDAKPVEWVANQITKLWGNGRWEQSAGNHPHEAHTLKLDCSKAKNRLGWQPLLSLDEALEMTVSWYKEYKQAQEIRTFTEAQITEYESRLLKTAAQ